MRRIMAVWVAVASLGLWTVPAGADSAGDMMSMLEGMKRQMTEMQRTIERQSVKIQQLEARQEMKIPGPAYASATAAAPQMTDADWQKGIKDNLGESVPWMKGLKFSGDTRLRYEAFDYFDKNDDAGSTGTTADRSRNRMRVRLRAGFEKDFGDDVKTGFRLASGKAGTNGIATDNTSPNVTLGDPGYFTYKNIYIDRAYGTWEPNGLKDYGMLKGVKLGGGKFDNPFFRYSTAILWDGDVAPEGTFEQINLRPVSTEEAKFNIYNTLGQFISNENAGMNTDALVFGYQSAFNLSTYRLGDGERPVELTQAVSLYEYINWGQTVSASGNTASTSYLRTNTVAADGFRVLDLYPEVTFHLNGTPLTVWGDYAVNLKNGGTDTVAALGNDIHDEDEAWGVGFKYNKAKAKGTWEGFYGYYEIGGNAVVAAFNDSDFGGPGTQGYTNRQGHKFGLTYMLTDSLSLGWTAYVVEPLHPAPSTVVASSTNEKVFRSQLDFVYKF